MCSLSQTNGDDSISMFRIKMSDFVPNSYTIRGTRFNVMLSIFSISVQMLSQNETTYKVPVELNQKICSPGEIWNNVHFAISNYSTKIKWRLDKKNALIIAEVKRFHFCEFAHVIFCDFAKCLNWWKIQLFLFFPNLKPYIHILKIQIQVLHQRRSKIWSKYRWRLDDKKLLENEK